MTSCKPKWTCRKFLSRDQAMTAPLTDRYMAAPAQGRRGEAQGGEMEQLSDKMLAYDLAVGQFEDQIYEAGAGFDYTGIRGDSYDLSIEFDGVPNGAILTITQQKIIFDHGFLRAWTNHQDGSETYYYWQHDQPFSPSKAHPHKPAKPSPTPDAGENPIDDAELDELLDTHTGQPRPSNAENLEQALEAAEKLPPTEALKNLMRGSDAEGKVIYPPDMLPSPDEGQTDGQPRPSPAIAEESEIRELVKELKAFGSGTVDGTSPFRVCRQAAVTILDLQARAQIYKRFLKEAQAALAKARSQLPVGMEHCTILFKECGHGHGRLTATNWVDNGCLVCALAKAQAENERLRAALEGIEKGSTAYMNNWQRNVARAALTKGEE